MSTSKRFSALLIALVMIITSLPITALAASKAPAKPKSLSSSVTSSSVTLKWGKVKKASGYVVYKYDTKKKKYKKLGTTKKNKYTVKKLKSAASYVYAVKSYKTVRKKKYYSAYSAKHKTSTAPGKVTGVAVSDVGTNGFVVSWKSTKRTSGYKLQYSSNVNFASDVVTISTKAKSRRLNSLSSGTTYYVRVYAYRKVGKKTYQAKPSSVVSAATIAVQPAPAPVPAPNPVVPETPTQPTVNPEPVVDQFIATKSAVDESKTYQTIDGFGASGAWWAQKVGGWENTEDFIKLLYSKNEGIGLNIFRYNLGAGTNDDSKIDHGKSAESFVESIDGENINFDWSRDANAQNALAIAKKCYGDDLKVTLFANSPPALMTINGKGYCDPSDEPIKWENNGITNASKAKFKENLSEANYELYSKYLVSCADYFVGKGYNVTDVSPMNEPQYAWACDNNGNMSQEGCYYSPMSARMLLRQTAKAANGKSYKISMFESCGVKGELKQPERYWDDCFKSYMDSIMNSNDNKAYFDTVSVHSYWTNAEDKKEFIKDLNANYPNVKVACTEYCQMTGDGNNGITEWYSNIKENGEKEEYFKIKDSILAVEQNNNCVSIVPGVQLARTIYEDLTIINATQWNWWTAVSGGYYPDGLVYYDGPEIGESAWDNTAKTVQTSKRLWSLGNYSKFIQPGAKRVEVNEAQSSLLSSAYKNPDGSLVIVYVNQNNNNMTVNVNANGYTSYSAYETSESKDLELSQSGAYAYSTGISIPAQSVVTVVLK